MPVYPGRRPGTWRITVYSHGKQHEEVVEGSKRDATRREAKLRLALAAKIGPAVSRAEPTFATLVDDHYTTFAELHIPKTWHDCRKYQVEQLKKHFGSVKVTSLGPHVQRYAKHEIGRGVKSSTVNHDLHVLKTILRWGAKHNLVDVVVPIDSLPDRGKRRVHFWKTNEVSKLYLTAQSKAPWLVPMLHFLFDTGVRKGELVAARWEWVDQDAKMLRIPSNEVWHPKDKDAREVPLSDGLLATLSGLPRSGAFIFMTRLGKGYAEFPDKQFKACVEAAGLKGTPHSTRHTYASHFLATTPDLRLLADVLGHSTTRVTELYAHMLPDHLERARGAVNLAPNLANPGPAKNDGGHSGHASPVAQVAEILDKKA